MTNDGLVDQALTELGRSNTGPFAKLLRQLSGTNGAAAFEVPILFWDPSVPWATIQALLALFPGAIEIQLLRGTVYPVPGGLGSIDFHQSYFKCVPFGDQPAIVDVGDGTVFHDPGYNYGNLLVAMHPSAAPSLTFTPPAMGSPTVLISFFSAAYMNLGAHQMIDVPDNGFFIQGQLFGPSYRAAPVPAGPFLSIGHNAIALVLAVDNGANPPWDTNQVVTVDNTGLFGVIEDGTISDFSAFLPLPGYTGIGPLHATQGRTASSGPTSWRPIAFGPVLDGTTYKDTTTAQYLAWDTATLTWIPL